MIARFAERLSLFAVAGSVLLLGACAGTDNSTPPSPLPEIVDFAKVQTAWKGSVGKAGDSAFVPAVDNGHIWATGENGKIVEFNEATGREELKFDTGHTLTSGVTVGADLIVVGTAKAEVVAFDKHGTQMWLSRVSSEVLAAPVITGGMVIVRTTDGNISALNAADGQRKWLFQRALPTLTLRSYSAVTVLDEVVLAGLPGGKLIAISVADGSVRWEAVVAQPKGSTELERITDVASLPVMVDGVVCAVAYQGRVACFDSKNGNLLWSRDLSSSYGVSGERGTIYVTDETGAVSAYDIRTGRNLWKQARLLARKVTAPTVFGRFVVVGDYEGYVHFLSASDGSFLTRVKTDDTPILMAPRKVNERIVVQTAGGSLFALAVPE